MQVEVPPRQLRARSRLWLAAAPNRVPANPPDFPIKPLARPARG
jgi:hypothetical protein